MKNFTYAVGILTSSVILVTSCANEQDSSRRKKFFGPSGMDEYTTVDVEAASTAEDGMFALAGEAVQSMKLKVSCDGVAEEVVEDSQFDLPVGAKNCKAKLIAIKIGAKKYVEPAAGSGFSHYLKNDVGKLVNEANPKEVIYLKVKQQLPSPLTANASVQYAYSAVTQFDTIDADNAAVEPEAKPQGVAAPELKVSKAFIGPHGGLNVHIECTAAAGFEGTTIDNLKCGGADIKSMKIGIEPQVEGAVTKERLAEITAKSDQVEKFSVNGKSAIYSLSAKVITLNFGKLKDRKTQILVASRSKDNVASYAYGFIRLNGTNVMNVSECPAQGARANFVQDAVNLDASNIGAWIDTSNCWVWQRVITTKVKSKERFKQCPALKAGEKIQHRTLPYFKELKAARERNIHVLGKGVAPGLGANIDQETFWLAGGRVFDMKDGSVREVKDIKANEEHHILCVTKREK